MINGSKDRRKLLLKLNSVSLKRWSLPRSPAKHHELDFFFFFYLLEEGGQQLSDFLPFVRFRGYNIPAILFHSNMICHLNFLLKKKIYLFVIRHLFNFIYYRQLMHVTVILGISQSQIWKTFKWDQSIIEYRSIDKFPTYIR